MPIPTKVCKIPNMLMVGIFFRQFGRDFFTFKVPPKEILHSQVSLIIFNWIINQQNPNKIKLFGQVGRVENRGLDPYQGTRYLGQILFGHMSKLSYFFLEASLNHFNQINHFNHLNYFISTNSTYSAQLLHQLCFSVLKCVSPLLFM